MPTPLGDEQLRMLRGIQRQSFDYFDHEIEEANGLIADKTAPDWPASIAAVGMALSAYPVAVEQGWLSRERAVRRTLTTLRFLADSEQGESPTATGHRGFYYWAGSRPTISASTKAPRSSWWRTT